MGTTAKEKLLDTVLVSFAEHGDTGTNPRGLAAGMALRKSALYRHDERKMSEIPAYRKNQASSQF